MQQKLCISSKQNIQNIYTYIRLFNALFNFVFYACVCVDKLLDHSHELYILTYLHTTQL